MFHPRICRLLVYLCCVLSQACIGQIHVVSEQFKNTKQNIDSLKSMQKQKLVALREALDSLNALNISKHFQKKIEVEKKKRFELFTQLYKEEMTQLGKIKKTPRWEMNSLVANLTQQLGDRQGNYPTDIPVHYRQWDVNLSASVVGIPLRVSGIWSNVQTTYLQPVNQFSVSLDIASVHKRIENRMNERIQMLKKMFDPAELYKLDKLTQLENLYTQLEEKNRQMLPDLKNQLQAYRWVDSLTRIDWEQKGREKIDSLTQLGSRKIQEQLTKEKRKLLELKMEGEKKLLDWKKKGQDSVEAYSQKILQKSNQLSEKHLPQSVRKQHHTVDAFLKKNNLNINQLEAISRLKDSLEKSDPKKLLAYEHLKRLEQTKASQKLEDLKLMQTTEYLSKPELLLSRIKALQLGMSYPSYTPYTLQAMPVSGAHVEYAAKCWYAAATVSQNLAIVSLPTNSHRRLYAGRIGWGEKDNNHLCLTFLTGQDDKWLLPTDSLLFNPFLDTTFYNKPRRNHVLGLEGNYQITSWLRVRGEVNQAVTALNTQVTDVAIGDLFQPVGNGSGTGSFVQTGMASKMEITAVVNARTTLAGNYERISPYYHSLGVPFLRNDLQGYGVDLQKSYWNDRLQWKGSIGKWQDNLSGNKSVTTRLHRYAFDLNVSPMQSLQIRLGYQLDKVQSIIDNTIRVYSGSILYSWKTSTVQMQSTLTGTWTESQHTSLEAHPVTPLLTPVVKNAVFTQTLSFRHSLQLSATLSYVDEDENKYLRRSEWIRQDPFLVQVTHWHGQVRGKWLTWEGNLAYTIWGVWQTKLTLANGHGQEQSTKQHLRLESSVPVFKRIRASVTAQYTRLYTPNITSNYQEMTGLFTLNYTF